SRSYVAVWRLLRIIFVVMDTEDERCTERRYAAPAGKATAEDPAGSVLLPRRLKRCPRKAKCISTVAVFNNKVCENSLKEKENKLFKEGLNIIYEGEKE
ncbi:hypothetical protein ACE1TI_19145, partial [Alteribacillus sp. JSM 102045]|uniref:hypothetical protein n=1 Tax=Alteribacillus sp. JSM 102045 TaxID=1562101 RepID=UPI0035C10DC6